MAATPPTAPADEAVQDHPDDEALMARAVARAEHSRLLAPPNPWVGCVVVAEDGTSWEGGTRRPGGPHAERVALAAAGERARGATLYTTLEPCTFHGPVRVSTPWSPPGWPGS